MSYEEEKVEEVLAEFPEAITRRLRELYDTTPGANPPARDRCPGETPTGQGAYLIERAEHA